MPVQHFTSEQKWEVSLKATGAGVGVTKITDNKVIFKTTS